MTIVQSKQKSGTLTLGGTAVNTGGVWTVTGGTPFACQATNVRVTPSYEDDGDPVTTLCGDSLGTNKKETWVLAGTSIQDFDDPAGFLKYCFTNRLTLQGFTWQASPTAPKWQGQVTVVALEEGGDVNTRLTTDWEFEVNGSPSRGTATGPALMAANTGAAQTTTESQAEAQAQAEREQPQQQDAAA